MVHVSVYRAAEVVAANHVVKNIYIASQPSLRPATFAIERHAAARGIVYRRHAVC